MTTLLPPLAQYALRLGDDALIAGQRLSDWCGHAPMLEIDLGLANVALDLVGQATLFLTLAAEIEGGGRNADDLAFRRDVLDFSNCLLVEQPNGDFARTIARHFVLATFQEAQFAALAHVAEPRFAAIAAKALKEVSYHARLFCGWVVRLGDGTDESARRMTEGIDWNWRFVDELFHMDALETALVGQGMAVDRTVLRDAWRERITATLAQAKLTTPAAHRPVVGGRKGRHSEHLGPLLAEMQFLPRAYPDATW